MKCNPNQMAELLKDPDWSDIGNLPSNFYPYEYKVLYVRALTVKHLRLLSKAIVMQDIDYQKRAVDLAISQDVNTLTNGDYFYILEWLKMHSAPKSPLIVEWHCKDNRLQHKATKEFVSNDPKTLAEIAPTLNSDDYDLVPCTCHNTEILHMVDLEVLQLPEEDWKGLPEGFDFPRVANLKEVQEALKDPELNLLVGPAQWIHAEPKEGQEYATLADRIEILEAQKDLDLFNTGIILNSTVVHGIAKSATLHCRVCLSAHLHPIVVDSASFFQ